MKIDINSEDVLYIQCPHCGKGWYARVKYYELVPYTYPDGTVCDNIEGPFGNLYLKSYVVEGINETDVTKELTCLNCGEKYVPINSVTGAGSEHDMLMWEFVAKALTTVKGS